MFKSNPKKTGDYPKSAPTGDLKSFLGGLVLAILGVYMVFQITSVQTSWYTWHIGGFALPGGTVTIPLLIGIGMLFYNPESFFAKFIVFIGIAIILLTIIMSVRLVFRSTSLFNYILMFGSIVGGVGLMARGLFAKSKN
ncbi:MAG: hypothetical protein ACRCTE_12820 [Cellulosilyticaceae bacterium]